MQLTSEETAKNQGELSFGRPRKIKLSLWPEENLAWRPRKSRSFEIYLFVRFWKNLRMVTIRDR
jgi:hypothetical protein